MFGMNMEMELLQQNQIQNHPNPPITLQPRHVQSLCSYITFFQQFLQLYFNGVPKGLENRIADAVHAAEDVIESHIVDQIQQEGSNTISSDLVSKKFKAKRGYQLRLRVRVVTVVLIKIKLRQKLQHRSFNQIQFKFGGNETHQQRRRVRALAVYISADRVQDFVIRNFHGNLYRVIVDMGSVIKEAMEIKSKIEIQDHLPLRSINPNPSSKVSHFKKNDVVGCNDILIQLMDKLTGYPSSRQIIPIHGMGGVGKTTLARLAYEDRRIVESFDVRSWVTISQQYDVQQILLEIILCQKEEDQKYLSKMSKEEDRKYLSKMSKEEVGDKVYKWLYGRRYLVILDDIWSFEAWDAVKHFFPDNNNGGRIVITTRLSNLASQLSVGSESVKLDIFDEGKSWDLLCKIVFGEEFCPIDELEEVGREIARNCKGLPLSIVVIGGLLAKSKWTQEYWAYTSQNLESTLFR